MLGAFREVFGRKVVWSIFFFLMSISNSLADVISFEKLIIYVPGAEGGGFDKTSAAIERVLRLENLVGNIEIIRSPGAGGLIATAQFIESKRGNPNAILIGGRTILGARPYNNAEVSLTDTTPLSRLTGTVISIAVATDSPIKDINDLIEILHQEPKIVNWVGGSRGSADELLVKSISEYLGINHQSINYTAVPGGGASVTEKLITGHFTAALSGYEELAPFVESGQIRIIAISTENRIAGISAPTLMENGIAVSLADWRGVFAPPGLSSLELDRLSDLIARLAQSPEWAKELSKHRWQDLYLPSEPFKVFILSENALATENSQSNAVVTLPLERVIRIISRQYRWTIFAGIIIGILILVLTVQRYRNWRRQLLLTDSLDAAREEAKQASQELAKNLASATGHIGERFEHWQLTESEKEIGWMLLKGLALKEISKVRGTSERTVRQQAQAIYEKSRLQNRSDLAAFFLEDLCFGS